MGFGKEWKAIVACAGILALPAGAQTAVANVATGPSAYAVAVNPITNRIYIANQKGDSVTVISGADNATTTVVVGAAPSAIALDTGTNQVYVANTNADSVTVIDGASGRTSSVATGSAPLAIAVDPATNRIYTANSASNDVTSIDGATHAAVTIPTGGAVPTAIAVNPMTHRIYVANFSGNSVTVIDGSTQRVIAVVPVPAGPGRLAVNPVTNRIYVASFTAAGEVAVIDGATNMVTVITPAADHGQFPIAVAANSVTNEVYVAYSAEIAVIAGASNAMSFLPPMGTPGFTQGGYRAIGINTVTNKIYVPNAAGFLSVVDGDSHDRVNLPIPGMEAYAGAVGINPVTNKAYIVNPAVTVIDGAASDRTHGIPLTLGVSASAAETPSFTFTAHSGFSPMALPVRRVYYQFDSTDGPWIAASGSGPFTGGTAALVAGPHVVYAFAVDGQEATAAMGGAQSAPVIGTMVAYAFAVSSRAASVAPLNVQGLWWGAPAGSASGWGVNLTQQGETLFATWFTYDSDGAGMWLVMSDGRRTGADTYSGTLYRTTGPAFNAAAFDPRQVVATPVGSATFAFDDADNGTFRYTVNATSGSQPITRQVYSAPLPECDEGASPGALPNYQDLWWAAPAGSESGWGVNVTHQGDTLFITWFTYGADGKGIWLVGSNVKKTGNGTYSGALYRAFGPPYSASPWNPAQVSLVPAGTASFAFSDRSSAIFSYSVDGVSGSKPITRQVFSAPATICR